MHSLVMLAACVLSVFNHSFFMVFVLPTFLAILTWFYLRFLHPVA